MPTADDGGRWYIYHKYDGKIVMDRADHTQHLRHHYREDPKFKGEFVAASQAPLTEAELKRLEDFYGAKHDPSPRTKLKEFKHPPLTPRAPFASRRPERKEKVK